MATTTPNFGWSVPTSSDLVKNGAVAIETLGDAIDASLVDLKGGTTNQVLAKATNTDMDFSWVTPSSGAWIVVKSATTFTNVASTTTTFDNVFSSSYKYYQVRIEQLGAATATDDFQLQLLYSGTTQTAGYYGTTFGNAHGGASPSSVGTSNQNQFTVCPSIGVATTADRSNGLINFTQVNGSSSSAVFFGQIFQGYDYSNYSFGGQSTTARTYTGFLIKSSSSNVSGIITVYGLAN